MKLAFCAKKKCAALGAGRGYRTELSMASQEAWDYAQQICSKRYMIAGILMAVAALLFIRVAPTDTLASLYVFTAVIALFEVVTVILLIASVETSLRKRFVPKTAAICLFLHSFLHKQSPNDFKTVRALPVCFL